MAPPTFRVDDEVPECRQIEMRSFIADAIKNGKLPQLATNTGMDEHVLLRFAQHNVIKSFDLIWLSAMMEGRDVLADARPRNNVDKT